MHEVGGRIQKQALVWSLPSGEEAEYDLHLKIQPPPTFIPSQFLPTFRVIHTVLNFDDNLALH